MNEYQSLTSEQIARMEYIPIPDPSPSSYRQCKEPIRKIHLVFALSASKDEFRTYGERLLGIMEMVEGLKYHYVRIRGYERSARKRAVELENSCRSGERIALSPTNHHLAVHEAVAYLNRLGQIAYFFKSPWMKELITDEELVPRIPTILALLPIRNKHTAHRQADKERTDDIKDLGIHQFGLTHLISGTIGNPQESCIEYQFPTRQRDKLLKDHFDGAVPGVEHLGHTNNIVIFRPTHEHGVIMHEIIDALETVLAPKL